MRCFWKADLICESGVGCLSCTDQPDVVDKRNGNRVPRKPRQAIAFGAPLTVCPSCGNVIGDSVRCFFCGQKIIVEDMPSGV